ncbi:hypothetical protein HS088_TW04G00503 [Tripterygium wilfordii]|uniref:Avr9/Cf-9 rapidly elicited protein 146 n=1 Tax=Tripterygium wilfordii TaxID=458696 RepID=A0A7J7DQF5_TRIWF|nr:uncharacterized protein LOC119997717 [Tripterygium wilfordii]KAF5748547.1 hypothetical protein HS088_TW04G00503 [Tripterygium wilfordii]
MEVEPSTQVVVAKKIWKIVRMMFFMVRKGISKSRIMVDLHLMLKQGKLATKAITNLMFHHSSSSSSSSSFNCRSNDPLSFVSPREYEFSCSNSPAFYPFYATNKRRHHFFGKSQSQYKYDDVSTVSAVQKVLEMLNNSSEGVEAASPLTLPGLGRSPMVRQLRITDSPFPLKDEGDSVQVDKAAEEFIRKFYKDLKLQKTKSSPCYYGEM